MGEINFQFENVTFVLNVIDSLAQDEEYLEIRKRKTRHSTLKLVESVAQEARNEELQSRNKYKQEFEDKVKEQQDENQKTDSEFSKKVDDLNRRFADGEDVFEEYQAAQQRYATLKIKLERELQVSRERAQREMDAAISEVRRGTNEKIVNIQNWIKSLALTAAVPPILVGFIVFVWRRLREREGIARTRLR